MSLRLCLCFTFTYTKQRFEGSQISGNFLAKYLEKFNFSCWDFNHFWPYFQIILKIQKLNRPAVARHIGTKILTGKKLAFWPK